MRGLEPPRQRHWFLRPARLPVSPHPQSTFNNKYITTFLSFLSIYLNKFFHSNNKNLIFVNQIVGATNTCPYNPIYSITAPIIPASFLSCAVTILGNSPPLKVAFESFNILINCSQTRCPS